MPSSWSRLVLAVLLALVLPCLAAAETVVARRRLGNNTEGMTYDPLRDRAYAIDGNDVIAVALHPLDALALATMRVNDGGISGIGFRKVFDVLGLDPKARVPRGIVWVPPQNRFYYSSVLAENATRFFSSDDGGHPRPTLNLKGLDTTDWGNWEGLAWIPLDAPAHRGTIAGLGMHASDGVAHVFYLRLDGTVEAEVVPQPGTPLENYLCLIQYWPQRPGTLLLSDCGGAVYAMDMQTGALIGDGPLLGLPEAGDVESVVVRRNGQLLLNGYDTGRLYAFDRNLHRTPGEDRLFVVGLGVSARHLGWNYDTGELLTISTTGRSVFAVAPDLTSAQLLFDIDVNQELGNPNGIAYLGDGQVAIGDPPLRRRGIDIADLASGHSLSRLLFFPPVFPAGAAFQPLGVGAYGPDQFLVRVRGDPNALKVVSRTGVPDTSVFRDGVLPDRYPDLPLSSPATGSGAQLFDAGTGPRIFTGAEIYDLNGTLLHVVDATALGLLNPPLRHGVWMFGNTFAAQDGDTSTVIVYTVP